MPKEPCGQSIDTLDLKYVDIHDGDRKEVIIKQTPPIGKWGLVIRPTSHTKSHKADLWLPCVARAVDNNQTWTVTAPVNSSTCEAIVDFNVPGKPNPPPCNLTMKYKLGGDTTDDGNGAVVFEFTDPSNMPARGSFPYNAELCRDHQHQHDATAAMSAARTLIFFRMVPFPFEKCSVPASGRLRRGPRNWCQASSTMKGRDARHGTVRTFRSGGRLLQALAPRKDIATCRRFSLIELPSLGRQLQAAGPFRAESQGSRGGTTVRLCHPPHPSALSAAADGPLRAVVEAAYDPLSATPPLLTGQTEVGWGGA
eukprot:gene40827-biopygen108815